MPAQANVAVGRLTGLQGGLLPDGQTSDQRSGGIPHDQHPRLTWIVAGHFIRNLANNSARFLKRFSQVLSLDSLRVVKCDLPFSTSK
jgi:hypothetical protein